MTKMIKRKIKALVPFLFFSAIASAQIDDASFIRAGVDDASKILESYVTPWANAFGAALNGSWYNTAKPHKFGGFDFTIGVNLAIAPLSSGTYDISELGLTNFTGSGAAPSLSGKYGPRPTITEKSPAAGVDPITFDAPNGSDLRYIPTPAIQVGIGLPLGSEVKIRYLPRIPINEGDISSVFGLGFIHSITQYIPGNELLPYSFSLFGGFTNLKGNLPVDLRPGGLLQNQLYSSKYTPTSWEDQMLEMDMKAWNISVIGSVNVSVVTFYGGLGYAATSSSVKLKGNFPTPTYNPTLSTTDYVYEDSGVITNFPSVKLEDFSGLRANIGFRFKLGAMTLHFDYTRSQYNVLSGGLGVSFN